MFQRLTPTIVNTQGIAKDKLLVALFDNAKKSKWTEATIGYEVCSDP